ncbi:hypothetical protein [Rhodohalobacter mucosus]|uniref:Uncharacterized protein n=1 Tax=Rhodohalobacter mucosus TaxID=2079485 RepID=A0A316TRK1_9BACT|nr:hypothetical protein [Rhodohalobacter mucosus]PWN06468.1 hypothetical protein DDZ15_08050 [Rhodohalobacter mucosus]
MLDKMKSWIKKMSEVEPFDASRFNDPLAERIDWVPLKRGGSNFHTHKMVEVDAHRLEFRPTVGARLFAGIFLAVGIFFPILFLVQGDADMESVGATVGIIAFGLVFAGAGGAMWYTMGKPRVFDKWAGMYWKGHKKPDLLYKPMGNEDDNKDKKDAAMLRDVHAIQLIREYVRSDKSSYYSYELNLILSDGSRVNVIDHGKKSEILEDAEKLGQFLGKPVWNMFGV